MIGADRALVRWLMSIVSEIVLLIGVIWALFDRQNCIGHALRPHLMSRKLAERLGVPGKQEGRLGIGAAAGSGTSDLVDYLAGNPHRTLEQEEIDPTLPV